MPQGSGFLVALANQGLNNLGKTVCWLFLVVRGSGTVGFVELRVGFSVGKGTVGLTLKNYIHLGPLVPKGFEEL